MTIPASMALIEKLLEREGGIADVGDGVGLTRFGQTPSWLATFNFPAPVNAEEATTNYLAWLHLTGLDAVIGDTPDALADFVVDFAVHSGHQTAIRALQRALGVPVDGMMGPVTIAALMGAHRVRLAFAVLAEELRYQGKVIRNNPQRATYAFGWANRNAEKLLSLAPLTP